MSFGKRIRKCHKLIYEFLSGNFLDNILKTIFRNDGHFQCIIDNYRIIFLKLLTYIEGVPGNSKLPVSSGVYVFVSKTPMFALKMTVFE